MTAHSARTLTIPSTVLVAAVLLAGCDSGRPDASLSTAPGAAADDSYNSHFMAQRADSDGVASVVEAWDAAWNAGNSDGVAATFTDDGELINGRGQISAGAAAIRAANGANLAGPFKGSHIEGTIRRITFLSGTTAVVDVDSKLTGYAYLPAGTVPTEPGVQSGRHKRVVVKRAGEWRTVLMQITLIAPPAK